MTFATHARGLPISILITVVLAHAPGCAADDVVAEPRPIPPPDPVAGVGPSIGVPPLLHPSWHPGWGNPDCGACHDLPAPGHTVTATYVCAQCHGGNGACNPNYDTPGLANAMEVLDHTADDACAGCHVEPEETHGLESDAVCANCHFRGVGTTDCVPHRLPPVPWGTVPPVGTAPSLSTTTRTGCYGFPEMPFSTTNAVPRGDAWETFLGPSDTEPTRTDRAVELELRDVEGVAHRLSELLATRPVWLQTGSYTCPVYQNAVTSALNPLLTRGNARGAYADQIHFVHVYTVEAHPPMEVGPYGSSSEFPVSILPQPLTYAQRVENAATMAPLLSGGLLLVDALEPTAIGSNPMWCTYGTCPSCSFLIGRDGVIHDVLPRTSMDPEALADALDAFLEAHP